MKTTVEKLEGTRAKLVVELTSEEVGAAVDEAYGRLAKRIRIAGFRKGKAPRSLIDAHVGRDVVLAEALEEMVERSYPLALDAEDLVPVDRPEVGELAALVEGEPYTFTAEVELRAQLPLSSTTGLSVAVPPSRSSDREIDAQIDYLRERFATLEPVEGRGAATGDFVLISFTGTVDGEAYEGNVVDKYLYEIGRGEMPAEFEQPIIGAVAGDAVRAEFAIPESSERADFVGKTAVFEITVHEVKAKQLPVVDDELAGNVGGFDTVEELRADIRTKLDENKATGHTRIVEREARAALAQRLEGEVPASMIASKADDLAQDFFETLERQGYSLDKYIESTGISADQLREDIAKEAETRVRDELALDALARQAGLTLDEGELESELERMATAQKLDARELEKRYRAGGVLPLVRQQLLQRKAIRWLMENVEVVEQESGEAAEAAAPAKKSAAKRSAKPAAEAKPAAKKGTSTKKAPAADDAGAKEA